MKLFGQIAVRKIFILEDHQVGLKNNLDYWSHYYGDDSKRFDN